MVYSLIPGDRNSYNCDNFNGGKLNLKLSSGQTIFGVDKVTEWETATDPETGEKYQVAKTVDLLGRTDGKGR